MTIFLIAATYGNALNGPRLAIIFLLGFIVAAALHEHNRRREIAARRARRARRGLP